MHRSRQQTIDAYQQHCENAAFFDERGWRDEWLHPSLRAALAQGEGAEREEAIRALLVEEATEVFSFPMLTPQCCEMLLAESAAYAASGLPSSRPNSMNKCPAPRPARRAARAEPPAPSRPHRAARGGWS